MSSIFKKLITALRGGANDVGESIIDAQATRVLEQELRDSQQELHQAKQDLASLMGEAARLAHQIEEQDGEIGRRTQQARQALADHQDALAREVAQRILDHQRIRADHLASREALGLRIDALKERIVEAERQLSDYQRDLRVIKTNERVLRATQKIDTRLLSQHSSLATAKETLARLQDRQQSEEYRQAATVSLNQSLKGEDLDARLKQVGIDDGKDAIDDLLATLAPAQAPKAPS